MINAAFVLSVPWALLSVGGASELCCTTDSSIAQHELGKSGSSPSTNISAAAGAGAALAVVTQRKPL